MKKVILSAVMMTAMMLSSFGGGASTEEGASTEVTIGKQVWMGENLNVDNFRNGDPIPQAKTNEEWERAGKNNQPAWCYYDNDPAKGEKYGKLYNWYAVNDPRGLAPVRYHIPTNEEWIVLTDYLGGEYIAGTKIKSKNEWAEDGNGTNESGFSGLPGGSRDYDGTFFGIGEKGLWWSSSENGTYNAWSRTLNYNDGNVYRSNYNKKEGFSVRCLRD